MKRLKPVDVGAPDGGVQKKGVEVAKAMGARDSVVNDYYSNSLVSRYFKKPGPLA